jgi:hypothetical protein
MYILAYAVPEVVGLILAIFRAKVSSIYYHFPVVIKLPNFNKKKKQHGGRA